MKHIFPLLIILILFSCDQKPEAIKLNKFENIELQKIYTYAYSREPEKLIPFLNSENTNERSEAALSFSSIQDSSYLEYLYPLLYDTDAQVRLHAAFAIGQTKATSSVEPLMEASTKETLAPVRRFMLEAIGRLGTQIGLEYLIAFKADTDADNTGKAWGIYRSSLKKMVSSLGSETMAQYAEPNTTFEAKLAAGHYFYRNNISTQPYEDAFIRLAQNDVEPDIRMAYTRALRNSITKKSQNALLQILKTDTVYNVRVDAINALRSHNYSEVKNAIWKVARTDKHISVRIAATEFFKNAKTQVDAELFNNINTLDNWRLKTNMLGAFMRGKMLNEASAMAQESLAKAENKFEIKALLEVLLLSTQNVEFVCNYLNTVEDRDIILGASYTLSALLENKQLNAEILSPFLNTWIQSENPYLVRQAAQFYANNNVSFLVSEENLLKAKHNLRNTKDKTVIKAIDNVLKIIRTPDTTLTNWDAEYFEEPKTFKTFDWNKIVIIPSDLKIRVYTEKGEFTMQMLVEDAPFTVAHFIELINEEAFSGIPFYRVIPNFVNQTGGSKNVRYDKLASMRIRSEFAVSWHRTATVNMASYGRDTESSHFSIMLCPTPWNDNNYTIFAKVVENMNVVHHLEMGDIIYGMEILCRHKL